LSLAFIVFIKLKKCKIIEDILKIIINASDNLKKKSLKRKKYKETNVFLIVRKNEIHQSLKA